MNTIKIDNLIYIPFSSDKKYEIFKTCGTIIYDNFLNELDDLKDDDFLNSDYESNGKRHIDKNVRDSFIFKKMLKLELNILNQPKNLVFDNKFEFIKYKLGGYFDIHSDRKRNDNHTHAILLYPPQNTKGGDLVLYFNDKTYTHKLESVWSCIIFPIEIKHKSLVVEKGEKKIIKGIGMTV